MVMSDDISNAKAVGEECCKVVLSGVGQVLEGLEFEKVSMLEMGQFHRIPRLEVLTRSSSIDK
jgi:hypothetical protein